MHATNNSATRALYIGTLQNALKTLYFNSSTKQFDYTSTESIDYLLFKLLNIYILKERSLHARFELNFKEYRVQDALISATKKDVLFIAKLIYQFLEHNHLYQSRLFKTISSHHHRGDLFEFKKDYDENRYAIGDTINYDNIGFDFESYKMLRIASSLEEIQAVRDVKTKCVLLYSLLIYEVIDTYDFITAQLKQSGYILLVRHNLNGIQFSYQYLIEELSPENDAFSYLPYSLLPHLSREQKRELISPYCNKEILPEWIEYLDDLGKEFHIGTKLCKKRDFAIICHILKEQREIWRLNKMRPCQEVLSTYYNMEMTTYKSKDIIEDVNDFIANDTSRMLSSGLEYIKKKLHKTQQ